MAKISLVEDIMRHSDEEIVEFLMTALGDVRRDYKKVLDDFMDAEYLFADSSAIFLVYDVLKAMKKRNDERLASQG